MVELYFPSAGVTTVSVRAMGVAGSVAATAVAGMWLIVVSGPDMLVGRLLPVAVLGWIVVLMWFAALRWQGTMAAVAAIPVLAILLGLTGLPGNARLALSQSDIVAASDRARNGDKPARAGLYGIERTQVDDRNGCVVFVTQSSMIGEYGIAHCPDGVDGQSLVHAIGEIYRYEYVD